MILSLVMFVGIIYVGKQNSEINLVSGAGDTGDVLIPQNILLLLTVILTIFFVVCENLQSRLVSMLTNAKIICLFGMMSYSIFIWHQPILTFYRYFFSSHFTILFALFFFAVVFALSLALLRLMTDFERCCIYLNYN